MKETYIGVDVVEGRGQDYVGGEGGADEQELDVWPEWIPFWAGLHPRIVQVPPWPRQGTCHPKDVPLLRVLEVAVNYILVLVISLIHNSY